MVLDKGYEKYFILDFTLAHFQCFTSSLAM